MSRNQRIAGDDPVRHELDDDLAVMVGDRVFDVLGAHADGIAAIGVTWGIGDRAGLAWAGADLVTDVLSSSP